MVSEAVMVSRLVKEQVEESISFCQNCGTDKINPSMCIACGKFFGDPFNEEQKKLIRAQRKAYRLRKQERRRERRDRKRRGR